MITKKPRITFGIKINQFLYIYCVIEPRRSEAEHATSRPRRLPTILNLYEWAWKKHFVSLKLEGRSPPFQAGSFNHCTSAPQLSLNQCLVLCRATRCALPTHRWPACCNVVSCTFAFHFIPIYFGLDFCTQICRNILFQQLCFILFAMCVYRVQWQFLVKSPRMPPPPPRNCTNNTAQDLDYVGVLWVAGLISLDIRVSVLKSEN